MTGTIIITPTTSAVVSETIYLAQDSSAMSIVSTGYGSGESTVLQVYDPALNQWVNYTAGGNTFVLNSSNNAFDIWDSWLQYRVSKSATAALVGVSVYKFVSFRSGV